MDFEILLECLDTDFWFSADSDGKTKLCLFSSNFGYPCKNDVNTQVLESQSVGYTRHNKIFLIPSMLIL